MKFTPASNVRPENVCFWTSKFDTYALRVQPCDGGVSLILAIRRFTSYQTVGVPIIVDNVTEAMILFRLILKRFEPVGEHAAEGRMSELWYNTCHSLGNSIRNGYAVGVSRQAIARDLERQLGRKSHGKRARKAERKARRRECAERALSGVR